jgi:UDP-N-acetylmuramoyl-tripeptide--D-alanyl-D-alanine ligase
MSNWNDITAKAATKGVSTAKWQGGNIVIDSRNIAKGDIFLALKGEHADGHDFVHNALENGASVAIVSRQLKEIDIVSGKSEKKPLLIVADTKKALQDLAIYARGAYSNKVIAVTGSSGKTTTKEQLLMCFNAIGSAYASKGNYNNDLGLPISVANLDQNSDYAIFEMGMNHAGEIAHLTKIARPDIAIITNIGTCHIEFFSSIEGIADAKAEIFQGLNKDGTAIVNIDCKFGEYLIEKALGMGIKNIITYGAHEKADCRLISYEEKGESSYIKANIMGHEINYQLNSTGIYFATNSLACLGAVYASADDVKIAAGALAGFSALKGRGQKHIIENNSKKFELIDDSYNSNPDSLKSSLLALGKSSKRKIAILADMKELGDQAQKQHELLKENIIDGNILLIAIGPMMRYLYDRLDQKYRLAYYKNTEEACSDFENYINDEDLVLIKGSNSMGVYKLVDQIIQAAKN